MMVMLSEAVAFIRARLEKEAPEDGGFEETPGRSFTDVSFDEF